jgi:hyperosmotically inducible protein
MRHMILVGVLLCAAMAPASAHPSTGSGCPDPSTSSGSPRAESRDEPVEGQPDRKDLQIFQDVARQVRRYHAFTIFDDVNAGVDAGVVTLTGKVTMPHKRQDIGRMVASVDGVREVRNTLQVLPVSPFDEELRYRIARAIYGNPAFWNYAAMANPPIHIVVEHGRVTLTGVVHSDVERTLARSLAVGNGAFDVKNLLKTDQEIKEGVE